MAWRGVDCVMSKTKHTDSIVRNVCSHKRFCVVWFEQMWYTLHRHFFLFIFFLFDNEKQ